MTDYKNLIASGCMCAAHGSRSISRYIEVSNSCKRMFIAFEDSSALCSMFDRCDVFMAAYDCDCTIALCINVRRQ
jgi:hypothetical protein